jgi:hypothetical protein
MQKPRIEGALGLAWRPRKNGWAAVWLARQDMAADGYKPSTRQIGIFTNDLTEAQEIDITAQCLTFQDDMVRWKNRKNEPKAAFNGTVASLTRTYQIDPDSPFHKLRPVSEQHYLHFLGMIERDHGKELLADLGARDFIQWHRAWSVDGTRISLAHAAMTIQRLVMKFGATFELEKQAGLKSTDCARLRDILHDMEFPNAPARTETLTRAQCLAICAAAHTQGLPSIALAQAMQFEMTMRQKDVIGEWIPIHKPGISDITHKGKKWVRGLRWEEIDANMILRHQMSKARNVKILEFDLSLCPMTMEEIARVPADRRVGPVVISDLNGRPWIQPGFRQKWRDVADAAGIPKSVRNMDSRAGGTTETIDVTDGNLEAARKQAGHSNITTTQRYSRGNLQSNSKVAVLRSSAATKNEA